MQQDNEPETELQPEEPQAQPPTPESSPALDPSPESPDTEAAPEGGEEGEGETPDGEEAGETPEEPAEKAKGRKSGYQRKLERLQRQNDKLLEMLQRNTQPQAPQAPAEPQRQLTEQEKAIEQMRAFAREQFQQEYRREAQARHHQQLQADLQKQMTEARARHADFDDALEDVAHIPVPSHVQEAILTSEHKAEIMYSLAKSPAELARISALSPLGAARELGRLEAKLASGAAPQTPKPAARPPAPPSKVAGKAPSTRSLDDLPLSEYKRAMNRSK